jgi:hypothetical protein
MYCKSFSNKFINRINGKLGFEILLWLLFAIFACFCLRYQYRLLNYIEWGDESETIVTAKMMSAVMRLYSEIFNHHGPLTFLPGLITESFGNFGVAGHRVAIVILQLGAVISIFLSPVLKSRYQRIAAVVFCFVVILVYLPDVFGHMYKYQTIAGIFIVIVLSQYTIPSIYLNQGLKPLQLIVGNFLISCLPFLAVTYLPITVLLFFASFRTRFLKWVCYGIASGLAVNLLFLGIFGSYSGFFAYHFYLNLKVLPYYSGVQGIWQLFENAVKVLTSDLTHFLSLLIVACVAFLLAKKEGNLPWRTILIVAGLISLLVRGGGFHGMPYLYAVLPFIVFSISVLEINDFSSKLVLVGILILCIIKVSLVLPGEKEAIRSRRVPETTDFSEFVKYFTNPEDRIIAYSFRNYEYIASQRLPASGYFFYLPWQEKYNENPKFGQVINACQQIKENRPKIMLIDKWKVWDVFPWESYAGCIQDVIDKEYTQIPQRPYYVRKDLLRDDSFRGFTEENARLNTSMLPSAQLSQANTISLRMNPEVWRENKTNELKSIDILFGTYARKNPGTAYLVLKKNNGEDVRIKFTLQDLVDNAYRHFDIPESTYVSGVIEYDTGGGISVWERHDDQNDVLTCMRYNFSDGSIGITLGCPW